METDLAYPSAQMPLTELLTSEAFKMHRISLILVKIHFKTVYAINESVSGEQILISEKGEREEGGKKKHI